MEEDWAEGDEAKPQSQVRTIYNLAGGGTKKVNERRAVRYRRFRCKIEDQKQYGPKLQIQLDGQLVKREKTVGRWKDDGRGRNEGGKGDVYRQWGGELRKREEG